MCSDAVFWPRKGHFGSRLSRGGCREPTTNWTDYSRAIHFVKFNVEEFSNARDDEESHEPDQGEGEGEVQIPPRNRGPSEVLSAWLIGQAVERPNPSPGAMSYPVPGLCRIDTDPRPPLIVDA